MSRTKQTSKKSTDGEAPRKDIGASEPKSTKRPRSEDVEKDGKAGKAGKAGKKGGINVGDCLALEATLSLPAAKRARVENKGIARRELGDKYCASCCNGRGLANCCRCGRAICKACIPKLAVALSSPMAKRINFCCPSCYHNDKVTAEAPYFGLKWENGTPLFEEPLEIVSRAISTAENRVRGRPTLILQFKLKDFGADRCIGNIVTSAIEPYYTPPNSKLVYENVTFNLVKANISKHSKKMKRIAEDIFTNDIENVIILISTHSDKKSGCPFFEVDGCTAFDKFFKCLLSEPLLKAIKPLNTSVFLLVCGALVSSKRRMREVKEMASKYTLDAVVAFTAPAFIPVEAMYFCNAYVVSAIIKGERHLLAKKHALTNSMDLRRQTSVVFIMKNCDDSEYNVSESVWHAPAVCPWGEALPSQCSRCKVIRPFDFIHSGHALTTTEIAPETWYRCHCKQVHTAKLGDKKILDETLKPEVKGTWLDFKLDLDGDNEESEAEEAETYTLKLGCFLKLLSFVRIWLFF